MTGHVREIDHARGCPLTTGHYLYIGSMTKLFTAALVVQQVDRGALQLAHDLSRLLDSPYAESVTIRMLLNHTSGIPNYTEGPRYRGRYLGLPAKHWQINELLAVIDGKDLQFPHDSRHNIQIRITSCWEASWSRSWTHPMML